MAQVKVWNDNVHPYYEEFKGKKIEIAPKGFVLMEYFDALQFKGTFAPIKVDADGNPIPEGYKMIRVEEPGVTKEEVKASAFKCHLCGYGAVSAKDLTQHTQVNHAHAEVAKDEILDAELEAQTAQTPAPKKRGRPAKVETTAG